ncbi:hypothetical protein SAY87_022038 [Trapa incisa]|uniref:Bromo domain-containing protein n=1 Tax=Trapa incisa TaxID=236973 RepID=A0AAN7JRU9_9MYRT|nr:hypothetical protein SAY87_022038 [Trapa incisa]
MEKEAGVVSEPARWGTWEELLLCGAVLRHGAGNWELVASELRSRTPYHFTPKICKAKYQELKHRFSGCTSLFEELRKQRIEELRQALVQSESSIGSLESKLKILRDEEGENNYVDYDSSRTVSLELVKKPVKVEYVQTKKLKDGALSLSSSSFTLQASSNWSTEEVLETKPNVSELTERVRDPMIDKLGGFFLARATGCVKKRRGKRKRKDCGREVKEGSVGDNDFVGLNDIVAESFESKETSTSDNGSAKCNLLDPRRGLGKDGVDDLMRIFCSVADHRNSLGFFHLLHGQKRGRRRSMIRRHIDLHTIRTKLRNHSIKSATELFRDLLLLVNNALVVYSSTTREYKSALILRGVINRSITQELNKNGSTIIKTMLEKTNALQETKPSRARMEAGRRSRRARDSGSLATEKRKAGVKRRGGRRGRSLPG